MKKIIIALLVSILTICQSDGKANFLAANFNNTSFNKASCNRAEFNPKNCLNTYTAKESCCCNENFSTETTTLLKASNDQANSTNQLTQTYSQFAYMNDFNCNCQLKNAYDYSFIGFNLNIKPVYNYQITFARQIIAVKAEYNISCTKALDKTDFNISGFGSQSTYLFKNSFLI